MENNNKEKTSLGLGIDEAQWNRNINKIRNDIFSLGKAFQNESKNIDKTFQNLSTNLVEYFNDLATSGFKEFYKDVIKEYEIYANQIRSKYEDLKEKQEKGNLSNDEKSELSSVSDEIQKLENSNDLLEKWKKELQEQLKEVSSFPEKIKIVKDKINEVANEGGESSVVLEFINFGKDTVKNIMEEQNAEMKNFLANLLELHNSIEEIRKKFEAARKNAKSDKETQSINEEESKELNKLSSDFIENNDASATFDGFSGLIQEWIDKLNEFIKVKSAAATEIPKQSSSLGQDVIKFDFAKNFATNFKNYFTALKAYRAAKKKLKEESKESKNSDKEEAERKGELTKKTEEGVSADQKAKDAKEKLNTEQKNLCDSLDTGKKVFNALGQGIKDVGDAFGGLDDATKDVLDDILGIGGAMFDLGKSLVSGDVVGIVKGTVGLFTSILGATNRDKKRERQIKKEQEELRKLKNIYNNLNEDASKALGDDKYEKQKESLKNITEQESKVARMRDLEDKKKKTDKGKIDDYNQQLIDLNRTRKSIIEGIAKDFLQTDAKSLASSFTDGLVESIMKGEDALDSLDKKANEVFANMAKAWIRSKMEKGMQKVLDEMLGKMGIDKETGEGEFRPLSSEEREYYKQKMIEEAKKQEALAESLKDYFPDSSSANKGLEGSVKSISSEEAGALVSQLNAVRINQGEAKEIYKNTEAVLRQQLISLSNIDFNTSKLHSIEKNIVELNSKVNTDNSLRSAGL